MSRTVIFAICALVLAGACSYAEEGDEFFDNNPGNSLHKFSTYLKTNAQDNINPATGGLTIVATDISLPGRNGLDLNINRVYRGRTRIASGDPTFDSYSDIDVVPQWANMGMNWKCFIAMFVRKYVYGSGYCTGTLYLGDGSVVEFFGSNPDDPYTIYYSRGPEKYKIVMQDRSGQVRPVLYLPNGHKYYFDHSPNKTVWGLHGTHYWATTIEDNNGNQISINYYPHYDPTTGNYTNWNYNSTDIAQIKDTWGRRLYFKWTQDRPLGDWSYPNTGDLPKMKLSQIQICGVGGSSDGGLQQTWSYLYDTLTVADTLKHNSIWYVGQTKMLVSTLSAVFCNDRCIARYKYGQKTSGPDCYDYVGNLPNADRGQLVKVMYPSGGCDTYEYSLEADGDPWSQASIYSVIRKKGNADHNDLFQFDYELPELGGSDPFPGRINDGFWLNTRVISRHDTTKTKTIYFYQNSEAYTHRTYHGAIPLLWYRVDSILDGSGSYKKTTFTRDFVYFGYANQKRVPRTIRVETKINGSTVSWANSQYPNPSEITNYDNVVSTEESGRRTDRTYLHMDPNPTKQKYIDACILDRVASDKVLDGSAVLRSYNEMLYDDIPCSTYNIPGDSISNHNPIYMAPSTTLARGNPTTAYAYILDGSGGYLTSKTQYDVCGNPLVAVDAKGDTTWYNYSEALGGGKTTIYDTTYIQYNPTPNALWQVKNSAYGVQSANWNYKMGPKSMEWTPQGDTILYGYESIYLRPTMMLRRGDNASSPTVMYEYQDNDPYYEAWNWYNVPNIPPPPDNPTIYTKETRKIDANHYSEPLYRYYNRDGFLKKQKQGSFETDFTFNTIGLLTSQTNPHPAGQANPPITQYFYDGLKRLKKIIHPDGSQTNYAYGPLWRSVTDANGRTTKYDFDMLGRLVKVTDALTGVTQYQYNTLDKLTKIITPDNKVSTYTYDALGRLTGKKDPDTDSSSFWYDAVGNLTKYQDARHQAEGKHITHKYDRISRLVSSWIHPGINADSTILVANTYDTYGDFLTPEETNPLVAAGESLEVNQGYVYPQPFVYKNMSPACTSLSSGEIRAFCYIKHDGTAGSTGTTLYGDLAAGMEYYVNESGELEKDDYWNAFIKLPQFNQAPHCYTLVPQNISSCTLFVYLKSRSGTPAEPGGIEIHDGDGQGPYLQFYADYGPYFIDILDYASAGVDLIKLGDYSSLYGKGTIPPGIYWQQSIKFGSNESADSTNLPYCVMNYTSSDNEPPMMDSLCFFVKHRSSYVCWEYLFRDFLYPEYTVDTLIYGTSGNYTNTIGFGDTVLGRHATIDGLEPGTQYNVRIIARDVTGNRSVYEGLTFATDTLAFRHYKVHQLTPFSVRVSWVINYPDSIYVEYGPDQNCERRTPPAYTHSEGFAYIDGLLPGKKYYFRIKSSGSGRILASATHSFRTPGAIAFSNDPTGMLTRVQNQNQEEVLGYDRLGRTSIRRIKPVQGDTIKRYFNYAYDQQDNLTYHMYPDGLYQLYNYDPFGRLASIKDYAGNALAQYTYTAAGACSTETLPNGANTVYSYNPRLWLKSHTVRKGTGNLFRHWYQYDPAGNLTCDSYSSGKPEIVRELEYSYDALNRLKYEPGISYQYDVMGNRLSAGSTTYQYYANTNRLKSLNYGVDYQYDQSGNLTNDSVWNYAYNPLNKLTKVSQGTALNGTRYDYHYNADGLRTKTVKTVTQTGIEYETKILSEPYDDLVENAATGDGHDDARDLGEIKFHQNDNFLFFTIDHKYLYGAAQGQFSRLYIAIDTDRRMGSGATWLPDSAGVRVSADNAWEYCVYVYDDKSFGLYTAQGFKLEKPSAGPKKMTVVCTPGSNGKYLIKVPAELLGNPEKIAFVVVTVMPGSSAYGVSQTCDVSPGDRYAAEGGLITVVNEQAIQPAPGVTRSTVTSEGVIYDPSTGLGAGPNVACDLDEQGQIVRKYIYGLGGKHLAMQTRSTAYGPYGNACDDTLGFSRGDDSAPITVNLNSDCSQGAWSVQVNVGAGSYGNFGFADQGVEFSSNSYRYVHLWVKPMTPGSWLSFHCWDGSQWLGMNGDKDGNETYETGEDMVSGQWNEVWVDLLQNSQGFGGGTVRSFHLHSSPNSQFLIDGIYTVSQPWQTFWYHCDYLGSPRLMTDASGAVVWKQDYTAFGSDIGTTAAGNTHKFTGHVQDAATGQYYAKARYFTTALGRWSQPEPLLQGVPGKGFLVNPQKLNPYVYCDNKPLKNVDPNGLLTVAVETNRHDPYGTFAVRMFESKGPLLSRNAGDKLPTVNWKNVKEFLTPEVFPKMVTRGMNSSGQQVAIKSGLYNFKACNYHGHLALRVENGNAVKTEGPNSVHGGQNIADGIWIHRMNSDRTSFSETGSQGCLGFGVRSGQWEPFINQYDEGDENSLLLIRMPDNQSKPNKDDQQNEQTNNQ